jgi:hypothetical protein
MCGAMMNNMATPWATITSQELFVALFLEPMLTIGKDRVVNVRMQLSECIGNSYKRFGETSIIHEIKQLKELIQKLKGDKSADVREPVYFIPDTVLAITEPSESTGEAILSPSKLEDTSILSLMGEEVKQRERQRTPLMNHSTIKIIKNNQTRVSNRVKRQKSKLRMRNKLTNPVSLRVKYRVVND